MKLRILITTAILIFLTNCGVKQPVELSSEVSTGTIFVNSQPDSALIFLDGQNTFLYTPDTLKNIAVGTHVIHVQKEGFEPEQDSIMVDVKSDSIVSLSFTLKKLIYLGTLTVSTNPEGGEILIDGQSTGRYSPDTLQLAPGSYHVTIEKNGFVPMEMDVQIGKDQITSLSQDLQILQRVLFEAFGNVSCEPCVTSAKNLEKFHREHTEPSYVLFEYYANWPSPNDPFYKVSPKDVDERVQYYKVYTLPKLRLNGQIGIDAADYDAIQNAYNDAVTNQNTPLAISVNKRLSQDSLQVSVELYDYGQVLQNGQLRLFVLVYEDDIHFDSPPGTNGLKDFNFVFRKFLSDRKGDEITSDRMSYSIEWGKWQFANSHVVAFVQDVATQKIYQATFN